MQIWHLLILIPYLIWLTFSLIKIHRQGWVIDYDDHEIFCIIVGSIILVGVFIHWMADGNGVYYMTLKIF